jgi:hypothetical protein
VEENELIDLKEVAPKLKSIKMELYDLNLKVEN